MKNRIERDALGTKEVPSDTYYGIHTQRALENFPISGMRTAIELYHAICTIKLAACRVNAHLKLLDKKKAAAIGRAATETVAGKFDSYFVVDVYQAGAGTPTHMNVNEVIANRAIEILGGRKGNYTIVHPNDHVNLGQSTNDVFPTAMRIALLLLVDGLLHALHLCEKTLQKKSNEFYPVVKSGRTHLQDAVPIRLGQEVGAWATTFSKLQLSLKGAQKRLLSVGIGATAVGTGINTHPQYRSLVVAELRKLTHYDLQPATDLFEATQSMADFVHLSGVLREAAIEIVRINHDIILLSSGPRTGIHELILPAVEPGSSIMPGKVNPNMAEMLSMVCYQVVGNDSAVVNAAQAGQLELNVYMPVIAHNCIMSVRILTNALLAWEQRCIRGMTADKEQCAMNLDKSLGLATFLNPYIGYDRAARVAQIAYQQHKTIFQVVLEQKLLTEAQLKQIFDKENLTKPHR